VFRFFLLNILNLLSPVSMIGLPCILTGLYLSKLWHIDPDTSSKSCLLMLTNSKSIITNLIWELNNTIILINYIKYGLLLLI
jgi:hypothetical protein